MEKLIVLAGAGALAAAAVAWLRSGPGKEVFTDFKKLREYLKSKQDKKDDVEVQGTILKENDRIVISGIKEMEGVAKRVKSTQLEAELRRNIPLPFLLGDPKGETIRVLDVHTAKGVDSVMQLDQQSHETILSLDARVRISGCARVEGDTILLNPKEIKKL